MKEAIELTKKIISLIDKEDKRKIRKHTKILLEYLEEKDKELENVLVPNDHRPRKSLGGNPIQKEKAFRVLGDPKTWKKESEKIYKEFRNKPKCKHENQKVINYDDIWRDGDVVCADCGKFIRCYDAG